MNYVQNLISRRKSTKKPSISRRKSTKKHSISRRKSTKKPSISRRKSIKRPSISRRKSIKRPSISRRKSTKQPSISGKKSTKRTSSRDISGLSNESVGKNEHDSVNSTIPSSTASRVTSRFSTESSPRNSFENSIDNITINLTHYRGGEPITLNILTSNYIQDVNDILIDMFGEYMDGHGYIFNGEKLENDKTLSEYNVTNLSTIHIVPGMRLFIKPMPRNDNYIIPIDVFDYYSLGDVKKVLEWHTGRVILPSSLIFEGKKLNDEQTLSHYNITNNSTLYIIANPNTKVQQYNSGDKHIVLKTLDGKNIIINNLNLSERIDVVKLKIQDQIGLKANKQKLIFSRKILEDERTLSDYNIKNGNTILLVTQMKSGKHVGL